MGVSEYKEETGGSENPVDHFVEWLAEWGRDMRRRQPGTDAPHGSSGEGA